MRGGNRLCAVVVKRRDAALRVERDRLGLVGCSSSRHTSSASETVHAGVNPRVFLTVDGGGFSLDVRSAKTGSVRGNPRRHGWSGGLESGRFRRLLRSGSPVQPGIFSVPVAGGTPVLVASGSAPAVSPANLKLAFALLEPPTWLASTTVAARTTHRVNVTQLVGAGYHLENTGSLLGLGHQHAPRRYPSARCDVRVWAIRWRRLVGAVGQRRNFSAEGCL